MITGLAGAVGGSPGSKIVLGGSSKGMVVGLVGGGGKLTFGAGAAATGGVVGAEGIGSGLTGAGTGDVDGDPAAPT